MGKKSKDNHRRETMREAELQRERERDQKREARRMKREANLLRKGIALPAAEQAKGTGRMDVEAPNETVALEPTLRKKGTKKRTANFAKTNLNKVGVRKALPSIRVSGIVKSKRRRPGKLMKKQQKRIAKANAMEL